MKSFLDQENVGCSEYFESHDLESQIRDAIHEAEDIIESHISIHFLSSEDEIYTSSIFTQDLQRIIQQIDSIQERIVKFKPHHQVKKPHDPDELLFARRRGFHSENLSLKYHKRDVLIGFLRSMKKLSDKKSPKTDGQLAKDIYNSLKSKKYLIVLDNVSHEAWNDLKGLFPDYGKESRIMQTTKSMDHVAYFDDTIGPSHQLTYLSQDESWSLLHKIVFDSWSTPKVEEFIQIGKKIAKNCQGLPLAIIILGGLLFMESMTDWMIIASSIQTCENYVELIKFIVSLSYKYLPQYLRWPTALEEMAEEYLLQLVNRSLVSVCEWSFGYKIKTCTINDVFLNFIMEKTKEEKFFHISDDENTNGFLEEDTYDQRRLCIHKYLYFGIKDVSKYNTMALISTARSLIYFGLDPEYPLRTWLDFKFVRVLDARNIRFYSFPVQILKLLQLRYLALSYNGEFPTSICKLRNLQYLIVLHYLNIKGFGVPLYLPLEIWKMKELRHLQVMGSDLLNPTTATRGDHDGSVDLLLENLVALVGVSAHSCTPGVLERIPNLKKLGIQIEPVSAENAVETLSFLNHLSILQHLESLKCIVTHPYFWSQVAPIPHDLPESLRKITLSGCGFHWEYMSAIGSLPNLEVLKL
ncbi:hypothetical protein BUALT_Bualt07G0019000 [Buddleja alternifolia]|uniref:NB-ARC domain-containing protein n=1 Tax=Buddleja alternifolia TaxID=168488 RepID=A0AAV6X767_9LAMI|nr:hypothetical protein BUALT_Bualt07G0019000 [Buddleja alternifolia]